jgi:hypothetical protein
MEHAWKPVVEYPQGPVWTWTCEHCGIRIVKKLEKFYKDSGLYAEISKAPPAAMILRSCDEWILEQVMES